MLSISAMSGGQGAYYTGLAREDYYLEGGEPEGIWMGEGAELLGLSGVVDKNVFSSLFAGMKLRGGQLVQNALQKNRQPGWDLTFSAPKSVSVLWSLLPSELGAEIRAAHLTAVQEACRYLENQAAWTRRGKAGLQREPAKLVIGLFEHGTSRAGDPQLHTHALFLNIGVRTDGTTGTIESKPLYQHKMVAGALYRAELSKQLEWRLGLVAERVKSWFEIQGVSKKLMSHWSTRRAEIETALESKGYSSAKASEIANLTTRHTKQHICRGELFDEWRKQGQAIGWGVNEAAKMCRHNPQLLDMTSIAKVIAIHESLDKITTQQAYFHERDLTRFAAEQAQGLCIGAKEVIQAVQQYLKNDAVSLGIHRGVEWFTTQEILKIESDMLNLVDKSASRNQSRWSPLLTKLVLGLSSLNEEQKHAVKHIVETPGSIKVVSGMAGTGKTTMLKAASSIWKKQGFNVMGASLAGKAADGLSQEAGIPSATIAKTLFDYEKGRLAIDKNTVLVIDEAGMVGTRQMAQLIEITQKKRAKLVLVGDERQLQPIEAGGPFAAIAKHLGQAALTTIVRQRDNWARQSVHDMADGNAAKALAEYAERGLLVVSEDKDKARESLLGSWKKEGVLAPEKNLILAATNYDVTLINRSAQLLRKEEKQLGSAAIKIGEDLFHEGDRVVFTKNSAPRGVRNGQIGTITSLEKFTRHIRVRIDGGRSVHIPLNVYDHVKLGYAVTTHKSQGMTTENAFVLTDQSMQDKELSYVQTSRARGNTRIFTTESEAGEDLTKLHQAMSTSRQKELATDLLERDRRIKDALELDRISQSQQISLTY